MTEKWRQIQGKRDLVRVSGEFELPGFDCIVMRALGLAYTIAGLVRMLSPRSTWLDCRTR